MSFDWATSPEPWRALWDWLLVANLEVSENKLWPDLFKVSGGLLAFCLLGANISHKSADNIPKQLFKKLHRHDSVRIYRLVPPLNVWLLLNVPFSLALSFQTPNWLLTAGLCIIAASFGIVTVSANFRILADNRRAASIVTALCSLMVLAILVDRLYYPTTGHLDTLAVIVAIVCLFLGVAGGFFAIYSSDLSHVSLRLAQHVREWLSDATDNLQEPFSKVQRQYSSYEQRVLSKTCPENQIIESRFADLKYKMDNFVGFKLTGDGVCLFDLREICEDHEILEKGIPELTRQLAEYMGVKGGDTSSDPFSGDSKPSPDAGHPE